MPANPKPNPVQASVVSMAASANTDFCELDVNMDSSAEVGMHRMTIREDNGHH